MRKLLVLLPVMLLAACASTSATSPPPSTPLTAATATTPEASAPPAPTQPPPDPFLIPSNLRNEPTTLLTPTAPELSLVTLPPASKALAAAPAECATFAKRKATKVSACGDAPTALGLLDAAMSKTDANDRDAALVSLENCAGFPIGLVRALRADLAPPACGDALTSALVAKPPRTITGAVYATLLGQALAGRLARLGGGAPPLGAGPYDKERLKEYVKTSLAPWLTAQAMAIEELSRAGSKLTSYGRAVAAIEAGMADLRLVDAARSIPLPEEFVKDAELRDIYFGALEQALEPRKTRGRDAALVALGDFAAVGALKDERVTRARQLLSKLYGGRRIDALDALILPPLDAPTASTPAARLATRLPTFYANTLLDAPQAADHDLLRALLERGVTANARLKLVGDLPPDTQSLLARARLDLARVYWRGFDFDQTIALTQSAPKAAASSTADSLMLALSLALRKGPENAADMMIRTPSSPLTIGDVAALDALATGDSALAAAASFDAALLRELAAPTSDAGVYWNDVARRYRAAASKLSGTDKSRAEDRAKNAEAVAAALPK